MDAQPTFAITFNVPAETYRRIMDEVERQQETLDTVLNQAMDIYLDLPEAEDTPNEKVLADFREAWHEAMTGQTVSYETFKAEMRAINLERFRAQIIEGEEDEA